MDDIQMSHTNTSETLEPPVGVSETSSDRSPSPFVKETVLQKDDQVVSLNLNTHSKNGSTNVKISEDQEMCSEEDNHANGENLEKIQHEAGNDDENENTSELKEYEKELDIPKPHTIHAEEDLKVIEKSPNGRHSEEIPRENSASTAVSGVDNSSKDETTDSSDAGTDVKSSSGILKGILENPDVAYPSDLDKDGSSKSVENGNASEVASETIEDTCTNEGEEKVSKSHSVDETVAIYCKEENATSKYSHLKEYSSLAESDAKAVRNINNEESDTILNDTLNGSDTIQNELKSGGKKAEDCLPSASSALRSSLTQEGSAESYPVSDGQSNDDNVTEKPTKYRCSKCSCVTKDKRLFDNHSCDREYGSEEDKVKITIELSKGKNAFVCTECNFSSTGHGFEEHLMCHLMLRPYQCLYCKECFINRREISRHVIKSHNGAKMSCALRALRRAKGLIKDVTAAGTLTFMARVAGKVPLEKDPEKKKSLITQSKTSDVSSKSPIPTSQNDLSKESPEKEEQCQKEEEENKEEVNFTNEETEMQDMKSKSSAVVPFSKLREVLTSENPLQLVEGKEAEETTPSTACINEEVEEQKKAEDQGLKIIASYSLHDEPSMEEAPMEQNKKQENNPEKSPQPNFFMASPPFTPEPEVLSFLGPERPGLKYSDRSSPLLPPPSMKPVPLHSDVPSTSSVDTFQPSAIPTKQEKISNFFICSFNCSFNSISKSEYLEHLMDFHMNETSFSCYYCGHKSLHVEDMINHTVSHADNSMNKKSSLFICSTSDCQFGSNMISDFINHVNASHKDGNKPACNACVSVFPEVSMLQTHLEENIIHIVNCPHCPCKASDRRAILNHISSEHPGKPKMVSVVKQLICRDRKMNGYERLQPIKEMQPPSLTPAPNLVSNSSQGHSVLDQILRRQDAKNVNIGPHCNSGMADTVTGSANTSPRNTPSPASRGLSPFSSRKQGDTPESERSPRSETSGFSGIRVKEEIEEMGYEDSKETDGTLENNSSYIIDENGVRKRLYVPMSERHAENFCCRYCTFVARDLKRLACHERSHGMPPTRKDRFKCMFCPQGFDSEMKFRLHITCHPGLIKFLLYKCKKCEFDSNQKHTIVKHITCNRDRKHRGVGPVEDQYTIISRSLESRVLECEQCDYMTRHKVHMAIHYQREHGILRDKNEFTIEGLTPSDTPVTGPDFGQFGEVPPQNEVSSLLDLSAGKSSSASKKRKESTSSDGTNLSMGEIYERNELFTRLVSQQAALQPGHVLENQARKFKCPICKYLLPKAADLKNHVKRHSEIGQITLVMFRCKYCSCMSTARELLYDHLRDKHPGKSIALVKKIVAIDTTETDKSFAETSVEESLQQLEESVHNEIMSAINSSQSQSAPTMRQPSSSRSLEQLFVIPQGGDTFQAALQCPKCSHSSHHRAEIIQHVSEKHPEVKIISSDADVDNLAKSASEDLHRSKSPYGIDLSPLASQEEVLIVPDEPTFKETALCSRCDFSTNLRKDMVLHLQQDHPEISVMGRNSYPVQVSTMGSKLGENVLEESCVVGSGSLDSKLRVLYENYGTQMKCLICGIERPKKFFIHVHILRHLNIYLWKCTFCSHRGLQKYKMVDHIKKIHPGRPMSVRYLRVNVESRVAQFLAQFNTIQNRMSTPDNMDIPEEFMEPSGDDSKGVSQKSHGGIPHALGGDELDAKISCLYDFSDGLFYKCLACNNQFQRKFAIHRHIIISHLKVALLSCAYCGMEGVEKHQMVDHILACHQSQPVSFHTNDIDIVQAVANFLAKSAANDDLGLNQSSSKLGEAGAQAEDFYHHILSGNKSKFMNFDKNFKFPFGSKLKGKNLDGKKKTTGNKNKTIVDPGVIMLGREALDRELNSLYQARQGGQLRCLICRWEFPRKYPLHRHIMLKHLRMNLVACPYCSFDGVEKYTVSTHIKEEHRDQPISIKYIQPDVKERVRQFMNEMASGSSKIQKQMSSTSSPSLSMLVKMKREKSLNFDNDGNDEEEREEEEEDDEKNEKTSAAGQGLVVAMFGKKNKKATLSDEIVIKTEREDDEYDASAKPNRTAFSEDNNHETNEEEEEEDEGEEGAGSELDDRPSFFDTDDGKSEENKNSKSEGVDNKILTKFQKMEAYAPGSYRSPTGGKPKALDVITKIKVLKSREGPITKFYCEKCKFTSVHRSNIVRHIYKIHERYQTHTCPVCNYQTLSMMLMQTHMNKEHPGTEYSEDSFTLNPPHSKPRSRSLLGLYNYQQRRRKQKLKTPALMPPAPPPATSSDRGPKQYACAYCHYETNTQEDILEHTREKHSQGFTNSKSVSHPSQKTEDGSKACWDRSKRAVKRRLSEGSDSVTQSKRKFVFEKGDELIQCGHCDVRETSMGRMQHHMEVDHPGFPMNFKRIPAWRFVCKTCAVKTMATSKMKYHLNRHVSYRPYTCINCGAFFPSPDQCRRHARANRHDEQYMYVRNAKKEQRVEELLQDTRQLALRIQEEAFRDPTFDIVNIESFMSRYQDTKNNLKRTGSATSPKAAKKVKAEGRASHVVRKQVGKSPQTVGIEMNVTIKCYSCDFQANTVNDVMLHHKKAHPGEQFYWTELDRGFTCDRTGEALIDCDTLPNSSGDVGYSTKISLSVGSNSTRFKCKSCDFSSGVIQAMKSHLKSHQPKGYICPYCSRFFSGKEKLMRHQYCLHKGSSIWVIHLRKSSANTSSIIKASSAVSSGNSYSHSKRSARDVSSSEKESVAEEDEEQEKETYDDESDKGNPTQLRYVCNECSFSSDNLLQYRQHLSKAHAAFRQGVKETSITVEESEEEKGIQSPVEKETNFQCGYCKYQASEMEEIEEHHEEAHSGDEPQILDVSIERPPDDDEETGPIEKPLLNLEPRVSVKRIPSSTIAWYDDVHSTPSDDANEEFDETPDQLEEIETHMEGEFDGSSRMHFDKTIENDTKRSEEEEKFAEEGVSLSGVDDEQGEKETSEETVDDRFSEEKGDSHLREEEKEEMEVEEENLVDRGDENTNESDIEYEENVDAEMNVSTTDNPDDLARQFGLVDDGMSSPVRSESEMMIMEFDSLQRNQMLTSTIDNEISEDDAINKVGGAVGESDDEDGDEEDDEFDENSVTLASPLPMISLGDGVTMSPDMFSSRSEGKSESGTNQENSQYSNSTVKDVYNTKNLLDF